MVYLILRLIFKKSHLELISESLYERYFRVSGLVEDNLEQGLYDDYPEYYGPMQRELNELDYLIDLFVKPVARHNRKQWRKKK